MKLLIAISILVMSFTVNAGALTARGTVTLSGNGQGIIIAVIKGSKNTSCGDGLRYWFKPDTDYNRALLSMLLSAQVSGKNVYLTGSGAGTPCSLQYPYNGALLLSNMTLEND
jgi:hypothetical protein